MKLTPITRGRYFDKIKFINHAILDFDINRIYYYYHRRCHHHHHLENNALIN